MTDGPTPHENTLAFAAVMLKQVAVRYDVDDETLVELAVQTVEVLHADGANPGGPASEAKMDALCHVGAVVKTAMLARSGAGQLH